jgi:hypothetical protein
VPAKDSKDPTKTIVGKVQISPSGIGLTFGDSSSAKTVTGTPTPAQVAKVTTPAPATPAPKPAQPAVQDKICATNVIYRTSDYRVLGIDYFDGKPYTDYANSH